MATVMNEQVFLVSNHLVKKKSKILAEKANKLENLKNETVTLMNLHCA